MATVAATIDGRDQMGEAFNPLFSHVRVAKLATCNLNQWALDFDGNLEVRVLSRPPEPFRAYSICNGIRWYIFLHKKRIVLVMKAIHVSSTT